MYKYILINSHTSAPQTVPPISLSKQWRLCSVPDCLFVDNKRERTFYISHNNGETISPGNEQMTRRFQKKEFYSFSANIPLFCHREDSAIARFQRKSAKDTEAVNNNSLKVSKGLKWVSNFLEFCVYNTELGRRKENLKLRAIKRIVWKQIEVQEQLISAECSVQQQNLSAARLDTVSQLAFSKFFQS